MAVCHQKQQARRELKKKWGPANRKNVREGWKNKPLYKSFAKTEWEWNQAKSELEKTVPYMIWQSWTKPKSDRESISKARGNLKERGWGSKWEREGDRERSEQEEQGEVGEREEGREEGKEFVHTQLKKYNVCSKNFFFTRWDQWSVKIVSCFEQNVNSKEEGKV